MQREEHEDESPQSETIPTEGKAILIYIYVFCPDTYTLMFYWTVVEYARIEEILRHLLQMDEFQVFKASVDFEAYPDYCKTVAYPICLESIQERLTNNFYRRSRVSPLDTMPLWFLNCS